MDPRLQEMLDHYEIRKDPGLRSQEDPAFAVQGISHGGPPTRLATN
jgi:hypothetical protein